MKSPELLSARGWILAPLVALSALLACSTPVPAPPAALVGGSPVKEYVLGRCGGCHGSQLQGNVGPSLQTASLTRPDADYISTILKGRPGTAMPSFEEVGVSPAEVKIIVDFLKGRIKSDAEGGHPTLPGISAPGHLEDARTLEMPGTLAYQWPISNQSDAAVVIEQMLNPYQLTVLDAMPITVAPGSTVSLTVLLHAENPNEGPAATFGTVTAALRNVDGDPGHLPLRIATAARRAAPDTLLAAQGSGEYTVSLEQLPVRLAHHDDLLFIGYLGGLIDVFRWNDPSDAHPPTGQAGVLEVGDRWLIRTERITAIADAQNYTPDGASDPTKGRLIGGMAVASDGTLYVTHCDVRMNEYTMSPRGLEANLRSGIITAFRGPAGTYVQADHRVDLVRGLPRNMDNHFPLGLAVKDPWVYVAVGSMTDAGVPDVSKPHLDTGLSGSVLRINRTAFSHFPIILAPPEGPDADIDALIPGVVEQWATGVRNAFGLTFGPDQALYLSDNSRDGTYVAAPGGSEPLAPGWHWRDHLHIVPQGAYLGQPNRARGEETIEDGSPYLSPQPAPPHFVAPIWAYGPHTGSTGLKHYIGPQNGQGFQDLQGWLLATQSNAQSGTLHALKVVNGKVEQARVLMVSSVPNARAVDVAEGPRGEIVVATLLPPVLRIVVPQPPSPDPARAHSGLQPAGYGCVMHDEFECEGPKCPVDPRHWSFENMHVNQEAQHYTIHQCTDAAHVDDWNVCIQADALHIRARDLKKEISCGTGLQCADDFGANANSRPKRYTSGRIHSKNKVYRRYGYLETRVRIPFSSRGGTGMWPSIFLLGNRNAAGPQPILEGDPLHWPSCGELDLIESMNGDVIANAHWGTREQHTACTPAGSAPPNARCDFGPVPETPWHRGFLFSHRDVFQKEGWNTVGMLWTPEKVEYFVNGESAGRLNLPSPSDDATFHRDFYWVLNMAVGGVHGGTIPNDLDWPNAVFEVDYVRWYARGESDRCGLSTQKGKTE